jgi:hypothetical protein
MTPIDNANFLIVKALRVFERLTLDEAKKIANLVANEVINEIELLRIDDQEYRQFVLKYWKNTKNNIDKITKI